jgi:hypothetical protein
MEKISVGKRKLRQLKGQKITVKEDPKGFTSEERELFIAQGKGKGKGKIFRHHSKSDLSIPLSN